MKLLLIADLHYTLKQWDWLAAEAGRFDLVVVAGDLLDIASIVPLEAQIVVVRKYLEKLALKAPLLVSSGNHDIMESAGGKEREAAWLQDDRDTQVWVDGDSLERDGYFFSILPWWDGPQGRAAVEEQLADQAPEAEGMPWIWIYHPPPQGSPVAWDGREDLGDSSLPKWIEKYRPAMVLGGHIHDAPFHAEGSWIDVVNGAWVFNPGRQPGGVPTFTIIDLDNKEAWWVSAAQGEQAKLEEPLKREGLGA